VNTDYQENFMKDFLKHFDYLSFVTETVIPAKIIDLIPAEIL